MPAYLIRESALEVWRLWSARNAWSLERFHLVGAKSKEDFPAGRFRAITTPREMLVGRAAREAIRGCRLSEAARQALLQNPLYVAGPVDCSARSSAGVVARKLSACYSRGAFLKVDRQLAVASPELVFLQMASQLSFGALVALGFELCGSYPVEGACSVKAPLTSEKRLRTFLESAADARGVGKARAALAIVAERSGSVMETEVAAVLRASSYRGGYNFSGAVMNHPIYLSDRAKVPGRSEYVVADICWPESKVVVEYNGFEAHASSARMAADARKLEALRRDGWKVFSLTAGQFSGVSEFHRLATEIGKALGKRVRPRRKGFIACQLRLRREMRLFHNGT